METPDPATPPTMQDPERDRQRQRMEEILGPERGQMRELYWNVSAVALEAKRYAFGATKTKDAALAKMTARLASQLTGDELADTAHQVQHFGDAHRLGKFSRAEALERIVLILGAKLRARILEPFVAELIRKPWQVFVAERLGEPWKEAHR